MAYLTYYWVDAETQAILHMSVVASMFVTFAFGQVVLDQRDVVSLGAEDVNVWHFLALFGTFWHCLVIFLGR